MEEAAARALGDAGVGVRGLGHRDHADRGVGQRLLERAGGGAGIAPAVVLSVREDDQVDGLVGGAAVAGLARHRGDRLGERGLGADLKRADGPLEVVAAVGAEGSGPDRRPAALGKAQERNVGARGDRAPQRHQRPLREVDPVLAGALVEPGDKRGVLRLGPQGEERVRRLWRVFKRAELVEQGGVGVEIPAHAARDVEKHENLGRRRRLAGGILNRRSRFRALRLRGRGLDAALGGKVRRRDQALVDPQELGPPLLGKRDLPGRRGHRAGIDAPRQYPAGRHHQGGAQSNEDEEGQPPQNAHYAKSSFAPVPGKRNFLTKNANAPPRQQR